MAQQHDTNGTSQGGVIFHHAGAFWFGVVAVTVGTIMHIPMYLMGASMHYRLAGMPMTTSMHIGMAAILVGLVSSLYGLYPRTATTTANIASRIRVSALDDAPITPAHIGLLFTMAIAVTIDIMKPTALAFVMPGMTMEYGLKSPLNPTGTIPAAYLAFSGIIGTVLGSFLWGWLGDRIGRRASILYAGIAFIGTSICGTMPSFFWNMVMCFVMGLAVGGMLPLCYALLAETIPARHRSWLMILIGADIAGAYVLTSWLSAALVPTYSWRILWLIGLPTGLVFILLNRWIPESPRYLLANGREQEARSVMQRYGAVVVEEAAPEIALEAQVKSKWQQLLSGEFIGLTLVIGILALGSGLVLFGFNLWIPSNLRKLGYTEADTILRNSAAMGFPLTFLVAWMYGFWEQQEDDHAHHVAHRGGAVRLRHRRRRDRPESQPALFTVDRADLGHQRRCRCALCIQRRDLSDARAITWVGVRGGSQQGGRGSRSSVWSRSASRPPPSRRSR
jgi:putative MFS transporter